jgi:glycosyltransferase A (GT-A) superfamily protein (DUF2064 family)
VLVFASDLASDLSHRHLPNRLAPLLAIPHFAPVQVGADVHLFTTRHVSASDEVTVHKQRGRSFGERLENAVETLALRGYDRIVIVGRDVPQLGAADVRTALTALDSHQLVLGPDHRGGCWLIALHARDRSHLLQGIHWQQNIDFDELASRVAPGELLALDVKIDLDRLQDARLLARVHELARALIEPSLALPNRTEFPPRSATLAFAHRQRPPPAFLLPVVVAA